MGTTFRPYNPKQDLLLPPSLRDWLEEGHLAYFIDEVVDELDLCAFYRPYKAQRHNGEDIKILAKRKQVYEQAKLEKPERWSGEIRNWKPVAEVYLNPEKQEQGLVDKKAA